MKVVGNINAKKNIGMPPPCFIIPTNNVYESLAESDDDDDNNKDNNLSTPVLVLKQIEDNNSFDNYIASKVGVDNNDALAKKVNKVNNNNNNSINTTNRSKEGVGIIDIGNIPDAGNNSNTTTKPSIEPSKTGVGRKESDHTNSVANSTTDTTETHAWYAKNSLFDISIAADVVLESDSISDTSINIGDNLIHNTKLDLEIGFLPCHKFSESTTTINDLFYPYKYNYKYNYN